MLVVRCGGGKKQTLRHLFTECRAWMPQIRRLWRDIGKAHGWKHPRAPLGKWLGKEKPTEVVLASLGSTRVGCISAGKTPPEEVRGADFGDEGEESGPGPPVLYVYLYGHVSLGSFFCFSLVFSSAVLTFSFLLFNP